MDYTCTLWLDNSRDDIPRLAEGVTAFGQGADLSETLVFQLNLALEEVVTNIIDHGQGGDPGAPIRVELRRREQTVTAEIVDDNAPFDPLQDAPEVDTAASVESRQVGGLGLHLVKQLMTRVAYHRQDGHNHLILYKNTE